jgi:UTP--glucose-1-phosphate uridylyltransferase
VYAYEFDGKRYDCGSKLGYLQATVEYALAHRQLGGEFQKYLDSFVGTGAHKTLRKPKVKAKRK